MKMIRKDKAILYGSVISLAVTVFATSTLTYIGFRTWSPFYSKEVIAEIKDTKITKGDLYTYFSLYQRGVLDDLIEDTVIHLASQEKGVEVTGKEVAEQLKQSIKELGGEKEFKAFLKERNLTESGVEQNIRVGLLQQKLIDKIGSELEIKEADLKKEYDKEPEKHYSVSVEYIETKDKNQADKVEQSFKDGKKVGEVANSVKSTSFDSVENVGVTDPIMGDKVASAKEGDILRLPKADIDGNITEGETVVKIVKKKESFNDLKGIMDKRKREELKNDKAVEFIQSFTKETKIHYIGEEG